MAAQQVVIVLSTVLDNLRQHDSKHPYTPYRFSVFDHAFPYQPAFTSERQKINAKSKIPPIGAEARVKAFEELVRVATAFQAISDVLAALKKGEQNGFSLPNDP